MASNAATPKEKPLSRMEKLSPNTFIYRPSAALSSTSASAPPGPKLILLCSWMDARDLHIAKYITKYQALYPTSPLLLLKCNYAHIRSRRKAIREIQPAVPTIRGALGPAAGSSSEKPELLIHLFSNGGSTMLNHLYDAYRKQVEADSKGVESPLLPPHVTIFDSAPGQYSYSRSLVALNVGLSPLMRLIMAPLLHGFITYYWLLYFPWGRQDPLAADAVAHNDKSKNGTEVRRAYIYSKEDQLVDWRNVEENAADAEKKGFDVRLENFQGSPHVAHMRSDEERYWKIVSELWEDVD